MCLLIRTVHIKILHNIDADSCINALVRFLTKRGIPELMRSDEIEGSPSRIRGVPENATNR